VSSISYLPQTFTTLFFLAASLLLGLIRDPAATGAYTLYDSTAAVGFLHIGVVMRAIFRAARTC
jgi:hypothetical protein